MIIMPDNWVSATYSLSSINSRSASFTSNTISHDDWNNKLEPSGCVFLPAVGYREGTTMSYLSNSDATKANGYYWSSEYKGHGSSDYEALTQLSGIIIIPYTARNDN